MSRDSSAVDPTILLAHGDFVTALARGLVADPNRADDVVQDTWLAALTHPPRDAGRLRGWLAAVTHNVARQSTRVDRRARVREERVARSEGVPSTAELYEREAMRREIVEALLNLPEPQRSALLLRFYEGLPPREIARRLGVPVETARTRIKRGIAELRVRLDERHGGSRAAWSAVLAKWHDVDSSSGALAGALVAIPIAAAACIALVVWIATRSAPQIEVPAVVTSANEPPGSTRLAAPMEDATPREPATAPVEAQAPPPQTMSVSAEIAVTGRTLIGRVMDASDAPIVGALVYVGNQIRARGDEPFKPFKAERIKDGVTTDAAGQFTLTASGRWITAWHEDFGARTVAWADATTIVLPRKATLRGRLVDALEQPVASRTILLDREREAVTAADGSFAFEKVEIGPRGLQAVDAPASDAGNGLRSRPKGPIFGVRFDGAAGEPFVLVLDPPRLKLELSSGGKPFEHALEGAPIGTGRVFSAPAKPAKGSSSLEISEVMPGSYVFLSRSGHLASFQVTRATASYVLDLGTAALTVKAAPKTRVYVVPAGSDEFVQLMAGRVASQTVPDTGEIQIAPLPAGRYDVGIDREGIVATVELTNGGAVVELQ